jgi:hypothetical protein
VERVFSILISEFMIIQNSRRLWSLRDLNTIMRAYIILHNMILKYERHIDVHEFENPNDPRITTDGDVSQDWTYHAEV